MLFVRIFFLVCILLFGFSAQAQSTESENLLAQAEEIVLHNPIESNRIAQHILKQSESPSEKSQAFYLSALSHYVMGNYDQALSDAFSVKNQVKKDEILYAKSVELISKIFYFLQIKVDNLSLQTGEIQEGSVFENELIYQKGIQFMQSSQMDSAVFYAHKVSSKELKFNYLDAKKSLFLGEIYFEKKQMDSAEFYLEKALKFAEEIENPFLEWEANHKLAKNYLAMDSLEKFQIKSQSAKELMIKTTKIENNASNLAHMLVVKDLDNHLQTKERKYQAGLWTLLAIVFGLTLTFIILYWRNKSKVKTYTMLASYLKKQEAALVEEPQPEILEFTSEKEEVKQKSVNILKESERQILQGLAKFESSERFTNKDMSLGMLAAQLNTNTKYLSEIINRQKNKNFNSYINELRINYITDKLRSNPNYLHYKVSYLAEECGFSSHSTFTTVFKSVVGVSPTIFLDFVREELKTPALDLTEHE